MFNTCYMYIENYDLSWEVPPSFLQTSVRFLIYSSYIGSYLYLVDVLFSFSNKNPSSFAAIFHFKIIAEDSESQARAGKSTGSFICLLVSPPYEEIEGQTRESPCLIWNYYIVGSRMEHRFSDSRTCVHSTPPFPTFAPCLLCAKQDTCRLFCLLLSTMICCWYC